METYKTLRELFMTLCNTEVDTAVILGHINPDGDAVGSVMGVAGRARPEGQALCCHCLRLRSAGPHCR